MKILFIGCVQSSYLFLKKLMEIHADVAGVITKESSPSNSDFVNLAPLCSQADIPCHPVKNVNDDDSVAFIRETGADVGFCFGWSQLIRAEVISMFPMGIIGFHPAALPRNRGRHPIIWALALGLPETASTFFKMDDAADTGDILLQERVEILYKDDAGTLYGKIMEAALKQLPRLVDGLARNTLPTIPQPAGSGNAWRKRAADDGRIDFRMGARSIYNLVRSLTKPYPGAHISYGGRDYKVWKSCEVQREGIDHLEPGKVLEVYEDGSFDVKAADHAIRILECDPISIEKGAYLDVQAPVGKSAASQRASHATGKGGKLPPLNPMNIIVVSPHPDDETLGAGGTLLKLRQEGHRIYWLNVTSASEAEGWEPSFVRRRREQIQAVTEAFGFHDVMHLGFPPATLGIRASQQEIISGIHSFFQKIRPDWIILPDYNDVHSDHRIVHDCCISCSKIFRNPTIKRITTMEILSETDYGRPDRYFAPSLFVDISAFLDEKIKILEIYDTEIQNPPFPRSQEAVRALARTRGAACGAHYAEAFRVIKMVE